MSGTYGFKQEKYEVSMAIGKELFKSIDASQAEMVATECATCQMQIEHGTAVKAIHPVAVSYTHLVRRCGPKNRKQYG